jgi:hypothetical protein
VFMLKKIVSSCFVSHMSVRLFHVRGYLNFARVSRLLIVVHNERVREFPQWSEGFQS